MTVMKPSIPSGISLKHCRKMTVSVAMLMMFGSGAVDLWAQNYSPQSLVGVVPNVHFALSNVSLGAVAQAGQAGASGKTAPEESGNKSGSSVEAALGNWQRQVMVNYSFNIDELADPFLPIKEVRGTPEGEPGGPDPRARLPRVQQKELSQLKLVAIISNTGGNSLASFEDQGGESYILKSGALIGRNDGRITKIESNRVIIEEVFEQGLGKPSEIRVTEKTLKAPSGGLSVTRSNAQ